VTTVVLGSNAVCSDGYRGEVRAVVIDTAAGTATHLAVEPEGRRGLARLVPFDLVGAVSPGEVRLRCTEAEFKDLDPAEQTLAEFALGYQVPVQLVPPDWRAADGPTAEGSTIARVQEKETVDIVPPGEVEEHGGDHVHATDGDIGRVHAVRFDTGTRRVTHVLASERHLLGHKILAIPYDTVTGYDDGIRLSITRRQVRDLPPADGDPSA
jgi:sporulation protein YlmC with PRC-barrel domain